MQKIIVSYKTAKPLINEADILLFRGRGLISRLIASQSDTNYSHVALASWSNGDANTEDGMLECVEFREGFGGRTVNLEIEAKNNSGIIDVYRPIPRFSNLIYNEKTSEVSYVVKEFNGKAVSRVMRKMTGLPYGWKRIWWIIKNKLVFFRLLSKDRLMNDKLDAIVYPVCSTAVAHAFNINGYDLLNNKSDCWTEPGHISLSPRIQYLFTIG